jgi:hypothetical protein
LALLAISGCATKGEKIDVKIGAPATAATRPASMGTAMVTVVPFQDDRTDPYRLGARQHLWGGETLFAVQNGTVGESSAQALVDYLRRKGWNAALGKATDLADITITGKLIDVAIDAKSSVGRTAVTGRNKIVLQAANAADRSQIRDTVTSLGEKTVFWFDPEDAQEVMNDMYEQNFDKFLADTKLDGKILKLSK